MKAEHLRLGIWGAVLAVALCGCSGTKPQMPPFPTGATKTSGAPAVASVQPRVAGVSEYEVAWQYPSNINARAYCWELETSADLVHWQAASNVLWQPAAGFPTCLTGELTNRAVWPQQFWRLKGTPL